MKFRKLFVCLTVIMFLMTGVNIAMATYSCPPGEECSDNVDAFVQPTEFHGISSDSKGYAFDEFSLKGWGASGNGDGAGFVEASSYGDQYAHASGTGPLDQGIPLVGKGFSDQLLFGWSSGKQSFASATSWANSWAGVHAENDGGHRSATAETFGVANQRNTAFNGNGNGTYAGGWNQSSASYYNTDSDIYTGTISRELNWVGGHYDWGWFSGLDPRNWSLDVYNYCVPGEAKAFSEGGSFTNGETLAQYKETNNTAKSWGTTFNFATGNDVVSGAGEFSTGAYKNNGQSWAGANTSGSFSYNGSGVGVGVTYGSSSVKIGDGYASAAASQTSTASTGNEQ